MLSQLPIRAFIFDLGDVLFTWSAQTTTCIPAKSLRQLLRSDTWEDFDCGRISREQCYRKLGHQFSYSPEEVEEAFTQARESVQPNTEIIAAIRELRADCNGAIKVFAMSNISKEDYGFLKQRIAEWGIFDKVFASGHAGVRKPDPKFYNMVLEEVNMDAEEVVFVDDRKDNILAARALGIRSVHFLDNPPVISAIRHVQDDPFERGFRYLIDSFDDMDSVTDSGVVIKDNFARLLVQDVMPSKYRCLVESQWKQKRTWNFFIGHPTLVPGGKFPDDLDTTSLALMVVPPEKEETLTSLLDEMLEYVNGDGRFQTYFDWSKPRTDEVVTANVLACFYRYGRGNDKQLKKTVDVIYDALLHRTYANGTRYYPHPDCCLFFFGRLVREAGDPALTARLGPLLKERVGERLGQPGSAIELAMRIITAQEFGIDCGVDVRPLLKLQEEDGGWPVSWMYRYGSTGVRLGNRGVATAMALEAIDCVTSASKVIM